MIGLISNMSTKFFCVGRNFQSNPSKAILFFTHFFENLHVSLNVWFFRRSEDAGYIYMDASNVGLSINSKGTDKVEPVSATRFVAIWTWKLNLTFMAIDAGFNRVRKQNFLVYRLNVLVNYYWTNAGALDVFLFAKKCIELGIHIEDAMQLLTQVRFFRLLRLLFDITIRFEQFFIYFSDYGRAYQSSS